MRDYILILELGSISGGERFNLTEMQQYAGLTKYKARKSVKDLIEFGLIKRIGNQFYITRRGGEVYDALLGGQKAMEKLTVQLLSRDSVPF